MMLHKRLNCFYHCRRLWRQLSVGCLLVAVGCQGVHAHPKVSSAKLSRNPLVVLGSMQSKKNYTVAALLGGRFTWDFSDDSVCLSMLREEQEVIEEKFGQPLPRLEPRYLTMTREPTTLYACEGFAYPLWNVQGFGNSGFSGFFQRDVNTPVARAGLQEIVQKPIRGFLLHVYHKHVNACRKRSSLDVMDFLLPYFKDAAAVTKYLGGSVCLVITGFDVRLSPASEIEKRQKKALGSLRRSMHKCYTDWYGAERGTEAYARLAKQKAFYDIFIKNAGSIKPRNGQLALDDFELDFTKVILFDPCLSVHPRHTEEADTTKLKAAIDKLQGFPAASLAQDEEGHAHWLWAVPAIGAAVYGWSSSQDSAEDENQDKKPRRGARKSMREDDGDTDDAVPEPPTSQAPQIPQTSQTPVDHVT